MEDRHPVPVFRRVGGLEVARRRLRGDQRVFRRVGGLEVGLFEETVNVRVFRRVGSLEASAAARY